MRIVWIDSLYFMHEHITATHIFQYINCPHWPYYDWHATEEEKKYCRESTEGERLRWEDGIMLEKEYVQTLSQGSDVVDLSASSHEQAFAATVEAMRTGAAWIYQGMIVRDDLLGRPDLLCRVPGASVYGDWSYIPIDVKSSHELQKYQKLQLAFYSYILSHVQGAVVAQAAIVNVDHVQLGFDPLLIQDEMLELVNTLRAVRDGQKPEAVLRKACFDTGVWGDLCKKNAQDTQDIALLYNVDVRRLAALRSLGVKTVADAAVMDTQALEGAVKGLTLHGLEVAKLQAQSLLNNRVIIREPITVIPQGLEIHFDIESDPPNDRDYLYGILIRTPVGDEYRAFVARGPDGEKKMWNEFLDWIASLPPLYTVYHFAPYEKTRLAVLEQRYGMDERLNPFRSRMVDLKDSLRHTVTFPLHFYGLKYIAKFLGFSWRSQVKGGGASVDAYEKYIQTQDEAILNDIILYNEDDVRATAFLRDWFAKYAQEVTVYEPPYPWS